MTKILVVDNYDSFVYNIVQYLEELGAECIVVRNDDPKSLEILGFQGVLVSPGPRTPEMAGHSIGVIRECAIKSKPMLGICLGQQALAAAFGARVVQADQLVHGNTSQIIHDNSVLFKNIPSPFIATRYHSLTVDCDSVVPPLKITARTPDHVVMAIDHESLPLRSVQFHPESILSEYGHQLFANWLTECGEVGALQKARVRTPKRT